MVSAGKMLAIALTPEVHQFYDNEWNDWWDDLFGSGTKRCSEEIVTLGEVFEAAQEIYADDPDILAAINNWFEGYPRTARHYSEHSEPQQCFSAAVVLRPRRDDENQARRRPYRA
jgi:hypothetical protein